MAMTVLVLGKSGQLARALADVASSRGINLVAVGRDQIDLADIDRLGARLNRFYQQRPFDALINTAAYTAVDRAEDERELAQAVNGMAPGVIGKVADDLGVPVIHISTDYVFSGERQGGYREDDKTAPQSAYGQSKLAGEIEMREAASRHFIVRTAWVYAAYGQNFFRTMLQLARERKELRVVDDQYGSPTAAPDLAHGLLYMLDMHGSRGASQNLFGTYHFAGTGCTTWCGFARAIIARAAAKRPDIAWAKVTPITTQEFVTKARRPANSLLDCSKFTETFGFAPRPWEDALDDVVLTWAQSRRTEEGER